MEKEQKDAKQNESEFASALRTFNVYTENGALSHGSTGSQLVDYFAKAGTYRGREQAAVDTDMANIYADSPLVATRIIFYLRAVTRKEKGFVETEKIQKGQGSRDEFRKSIKWLASNHPDVLYTNLHLIPVVGSWKDLWHPYLVDVLKHDQVFALVKRGIDDSYNVGLIAKFLPAIKSSGKLSKENPGRIAQNNFAKALAKYLKWTPTEYRKFKSNPKYSAHQFQRVMCSGEWDKLRFDRIPGKALFNLLNHKGADGKNTLERHDQIERYTKWLESQPVAKYTGYVYELFKAAKAAKSPAEKMTFNKQFDGLIELAKKDDNGISGNVWCALDTSGSMSTGIPGLTGVTAFDMCISLGIYFSTLNTGAFHNSVIMFDNVSYMKQLSGTFCDKIKQLTDEKTAWGTTNFESVIAEIVGLRKTRPEIPVSDFPETLIVVSDMQFSPVGGNQQTNYQNAMAKLAEVGLPKMKFVWWYVTGGKDFPSKVEDEGVTMIGGFDGSIVTMILGGQTKIVDAKTGVVRNLNAHENMLKALDQEVIREIKVPEEKK